jgi:nicotinate dehydrogenase subunit A
MWLRRGDHRVSPYFSVASGDRFGENAVPDRFRINVNGEERTVTAAGDTPLLYILRNDLGLNGPKFGCGLGQCGACTVILGGEAMRSCVTSLSAVEDQAVVTLEGLGTLEDPHPLQKAFMAEQAAQCGYCINGIIMTAKALLDGNKHPTRLEIIQALAPVLCRCGTHWRIIRAVEMAAKESRT